MKFHGKSPKVILFHGVLTRAGRKAIAASSDLLNWVAIMTRYVWDIPYVQIVAVINSTPGIGTSICAIARPHVVSTLLTAHVRAVGG